MAELVTLHKSLKCHFCGHKRNDHLRYGPLYKLGNIRAHYYCVLLSNKLQQNGRDHEGMFGFLLPDIQKELQRTLNCICKYCGRGNATINCAAKKCSKVFHLPCGLRNGSMHQFINQFKSFCRNHRPSQGIPSKILQEARINGALCCICYDPVRIKGRRNYLWAPCCLKTWYHRHCVQKLAHSAGYFFRCAACNDETKFKQYMQRFGIFVPQQDASWELVPNAFQELLYRHDRCDAENCKCPKGRQKNEDNTLWEIVLCASCGSQGMHIACGNLKFLEPEWECESCESVTKRIKIPPRATRKSLRADEASSMLVKLPEMSRKRRRRNSEGLENSVLDKRKRGRTSLAGERGGEEDDEVEIDVETVDEKEKMKMKETRTVTRSDDADDIVLVEGGVGTTTTTNSGEDIQEMLSSLKPGPLSYKFSILRKTLEAPRTSSALQSEKVRPHPPSIDLIDLTLSDEEDDDVEVLEEGNSTFVITEVDANDPSHGVTMTTKDHSCVVVAPSGMRKKYSLVFDIVPVLSVRL